MGISTYQIDNIIRAYSKQSKMKSRLDATSATQQGNYADTVTLSGREGLTPQTCDKISYSLMDILLKEKKPAP
jgi:hypothetical protein